MAINFPSTAGQATDGSYTYTVAGITYSWDGSSWSSAGAGSATDRTLLVLVQILLALALSMIITLVFLPTLLLILLLFYHKKQILFRQFYLEEIQQVQMILNFLITNQLNLVLHLTYKFFTIQVLDLILERMDSVLLIFGVQTLIFLTLQELRQKQLSLQMVLVH